MARIRTIKPDAFTSYSLSEVPRGTRWTFAGLWTYADDAGRARDDVRLIKAALYPIDDTVDLEDIADDLASLHKIDVICRYEVDGRRYLHMPKWEHQKINRPTPAKNPPCPLHEDGEQGSTIPNESSLRTHGGLTEGSTWEKEGKGKEGKGSLAQSAGADDATESPAGFETFWDIYDHKKDRKRAEQKYRIALKKPGVTPELLASAAGRYIASQRAKGKHPQFTKHADAWLNGENWNDDLDNIRSLPDRPLTAAEIADDGTILPPLDPGVFG